MGAGRGLGGVLALLFIVAGGIGAVAWAWRDYNAPGPLTRTETLVLPRGDTVAGLSQRLAQVGIIAHPWLFVADLYLSGDARALKAGEYRFAAAMSPAAIARLLASGKVVEHRLTVPEGLTSGEVVAMVAAAPALDGAVGTPPSEGSLLPDTYFFVRGDRRDALIARMRRAMSKTLAEAWASRAPDVPLTAPADALVLASIVEKETAKAAERPHIAGIYLNRMRLGMKLQADPTVLYALTDHGAKPLGRPLDHDDLAVASPYNTYLHPGLPPGPIANPGKAALLAAVRPEKTDDLYFVSDGSGAHNFARTLDQQNRNINTLRKQQATRPAEEK
ncbi:MAG TPA: endolytic transglycosylase MltG [Stellaceae bacterium]